MDSDQPEVSPTGQRERLRHQLANAERRLADAKSELLNVSAFSDGNSWGAIDPQRAARELNTRIWEGQDIEVLEEEVARLRRRLESTTRFNQR